MTPSGFNPIRGCRVLWNRFHGFHPWLLIFGPFGAGWVESISSKSNGLLRLLIFDDDFGDLEIAAPSGGRFRRS